MSFESLLTVLDDLITNPIEIRVAIESGGRVSCASGARDHLKKRGRECCKSTGDAYNTRPGLRVGLERERAVS